MQDLGGFKHSWSYPQFGEKLPKDFELENVKEMREESRIYRQGRIGLMVRIILHDPMAKIFHYESVLLVANNQLN